MSGTGTVTITGNDTLTLNGNVFADQTFGDVSSISYPNELVKLKTGKNGNSIFALDAQGVNGNLVMRLARGSADDQFMAALVPASPANFPASTLLSGTFVKMLGDGNGTVRTDTYTLAGGVISRVPDGKENVEGDVTQGEVVYNVKFANVKRTIG